MLLSPYRCALLCPDGMGCAKAPKTTGGAALRSASEAEARDARGSDLMQVWSTTASVRKNDFWPSALETDKVSAVFSEMLSASMRGEHENAFAG